MGRQSEIKKFRLLPSIPNLSSFYATRNVFRTWLSDFITNCTSHSPSWEAKSVFASQEILHVWWRPKFSLRCSQDPNTCSYSEPDKFSPRYIIPFKINFNIILPPTLMFSKWFPSFKFPRRNLIWTAILSRTCQQKRNFWKYAHVWWSSQKKLLESQPVTFIMKTLIALNLLIVTSGRKSSRPYAKFRRVVQWVATTVRQISEHTVS
jgi:hypothetical protein